MLRYLLSHRLSSVFLVSPHTLSLTWGCALEVQGTKDQLERIAFGALKCGLELLVIIAQREIISVRKHVDTKWKCVFLGCCCCF